MVSSAGKEIMTYEQVDLKSEFGLVKKSSNECKVSINSFDTLLCEEEAINVNLESLK